MARRHHRRRRSGGDPLLRQARLESNVQFGGEEAALKELAREARQTLKHDISSERGVADGIKYAIAQVQPEMVKAYQRATGSFDQARSMLQQDLAALGPQDRFRAAAAVESQGAHQRLAEGLAEAEKELSFRKVGAEQGRAYAVRGHLAEYKQNVGKIGAQRQSLGRQKGAFTAATYEKLGAAAADQALAARRVRATEAGVRQRGASLADRQRRTEAQLTGRDPVTGKKVPGSSRSGGKGKGKSTFSRGALSSHQKIVSGIQDANLTAKRLKRMHLNWSEIGTVLTGPKTKDKPYGGYGGYTARAAVELARFGHLTGGTFHGLRARGLIGHRTPKRWRPRGSSGRQFRKAVTKNFGLTFR